MGTHAVGTQPPQQVLSTFRPMSIAAKRSPISSTAELLLPFDVSISIRDLHQKKNLLISSSGSCDDSDATWQEIGCTCGSACSCLSSRFKDCSPSFRICTKDTRTYALPLSCSLSLIHLVLLLIYYWHTLLTYGDGFCVMCVCLQIKVENFCW